VQGGAGERAKLMRTQLYFTFLYGTENKYNKQKLSKSNKNAAKY